MNIRSFACPNCGAELRARDTDTKVYCRACGYDILLRDDSQEDVDEDARYAYALADEIDEIYDVLVSYGKLHAEKEELQKQKTSLSQKGGISESFGRVISYGLASFVAIALLVILNLIGAPMIVFFLFGVVAALSYLVLGTIMIQFAQTATLAVSDLTKAIDEREDKMLEYDKVLRQHRSVNIPLEYRNKNAVSFIIEALQSLEAYSVNEALDLYDDLVRRNPQLSTQQEPVDIGQLGQMSLLPQGKDTDLMTRMRIAIDYMGGVKIFSFVTGLVLLSFIIAGAITKI